MEIKKFADAGIRTVETSLRTADTKLRTVKEDLKSGLTSSVIGAEEDTVDDKEVEKHLSVSERTAYRRMPDHMKRRLKESAAREGMSGAKTDNAWTDRVRASLAQEKAAGVKKAASKTAGVWSPTGKAHTAGAGKAAATKAGEGAAKAGAMAAKGTAAAAGAAAAGATAGVSAGLTAVKAAGDVAERTARKVKAALTASMEQDKEAAKGVRLKEIMETVKPNRGGEQEGQKKNNGGMGCLTVVLGLFAVTGAMVCVPILLILLMCASPETTHPAGDRIVEVARAELAMSDENIGGYRYKDWYGMDADWCAMFVSFCADQCGYIEDGIMPRTASVSNMAQWYQKQNLYQTSSGYEPKPGDVVVFGNGKSHVGLVVDYDPEQKILTTIEGNTGSSGTTPYHKGSRVKERRYPITYQYIVGYGTPDYPLPEGEGTEGTEPDMAPGS